MILSNNKIIKIWGGLGNQLYQYAFGKFLQRNFNYNIVFNLNYYSEAISSRKFLLKKVLKNFDYETVNIRENFFQKLLNYRTEKLYKYLIKKKVQLLPNVLIGYWQDLYFANTLQDNDFKDDFFYQNNSGLEKEYYVLHFRGGDFYTSHAHQVLDIHHYKKSVAFFQDKKIYCISDDTDKLNLLLKELKLKNTHLLELDEFNAFRLIYNSQGGIASNSTFFWWAAFLSRKKNWVFPKYWLKNRTIFEENLLIDNTLVI